MALNINIHTPNGLVPISPELTYQQIVDVLGYTPLDVSNYVTYDSISEADDSAFYVVDSQQHILAQIDEDGLQAAIMAVNGKDVESGLIYDIKELADDAFYIVDSQSNVIAKIGENGLETTNVIAQSIITNNIESSDSELYIVDTNNRPILSVDANGLETTNIVASDAILSQHSVVDHIEDYEIHITEEERQSWNSKSKFDSISEDDNTTLYINDKNNKTIAKFDADGLIVTNVSTNDVTVGGNKSVLSHINNSSIHITDDERSTWNTVTSKASKTELSEHINDTDKHLGDEISLDDNTTLYINDKDNNTIVKVNSEGLTAAEVILQSNKEQHSLLEHVTNTDIHIQDGERESWNAKIDSSTLDQKLAEKTDKTDFNEHVQDTNLHIGDEITLDDNTALYIADKDANIIAKFTQSGFDAKLIRQDDNVVASNVVVDASTDTPYIDEDGTLHLTAGVLVDTDTNTTYTFTSGTNKFTVTPSNASSYDVSVTPSITVSAAATDDGVVVLTGTPGINGVSYDAKHAQKGPKKTYMRQNNPTNVSSGTTTLWIPQIAVDDYGHVTDASNASVAITIPTAIKGDSVTAATEGTSTDSGEYTITPITFKVGDTNLSPVNVKAKHGSDGKSISSVTLKSGDSTPGTTDEYSVKVDTTEVGTFNVYNGKDFEYKDFTAEQLAALTGPKGDQGLTIKGTIEPSNLIYNFPYTSKINDAYIVSRDASSGELPTNAKKGDLWICTKESECVFDGELDRMEPPVFNFSGVNLCGPAGKDGTSVTIKGSKDTADELPEEGNTNGDGYIVQGILFVWDGTNWTEAGEIKGPKGDPGPKGDQGFNIRGEISALIDLDNIASVLNPNPPKINDAWILNPNYDDTIYPDNEKKGAVWVYRGEGVPFEYVTNLRGPAGEYTSGTNIDITDNIISAKGYIFNEIVNSFAEGSQTTAGGNYSHAEGNKTTAQGKSSHAEGNGVEAVGEASHAEGWHDIDSENNLTYTVHIDEGDNTKYVVVSDFSGTTGGEDGFYLKYGMTFLYNNIYYYVTEVLYDDSNVKPIAFRLNQAIDKQDTENFDIKLILGKSIGTASHVEGNNTIAYGHYAHAEGNTTRAIGANSHTEGAETTAIGDRSHAEGSGSVAIGNYSHTEGRLTKTSSVAAHAEGINTAATNEAEHAEGKYNVSNTGSEEKDKTISSIGIGESNIDRKNAFEVMQNGDMYVYGLGDYDGTNAVNSNFEGKIGQTLQEYLGENELPQKENELIYFVENEGFVSSQLLLQDETIIIDNQEDFNLCTKLSDVETDVLGSWQQFTDWKTYSPEYGSGQYISGSSYGYGRWYSNDSKILNPINSIDFNGYMIPFAKSSYSVESVIGTNTGNTTGDNIGFSIVNDKNAIPKYVETESGKKYYRNTLYDILESNAAIDTPQRPSKSAWVSEDRVNNTAYVIYTDSPTSGNESYPTIGAEYNVYFIDNIKTSAGRKKYKVSDLEDNSVFTEKIITNFDSTGVIDFVTITVTNSSSMQIGHGTSTDYEGTIYVYGSRYDISSGSWTNQLVFSGNAGDLGRLLVDYNSNLNTNNVNVKCGIKASTDFNNGILTVEFSDAISDIENAKSESYNGSELKIDFNNRKYFIKPRNSYNDSTITEQDLPVSSDIDDNFWSGFTQETKFMYHAYSYQNLYIECLNILMDNKVIWVHNNGINTVYGLNSERNGYEIKGNVNTKDILSGSRLAYNPITKKLFYSDGDIIYQIASSSGGNSSGDNGGNSSGDSGSVGSQSFGGYVYIEKYDKTNFENALTTALSDAKTKYDNGTNKNAIILDCTYFTGTHVLSTGFTGFNLETPVKLVFGSIKVIFNNPGDHNLFNILHNDISIVGINRNTDASQIATEDTASNGATLFIMDGDNSNSSDNLNGYHIKSTGFKNILIDSITLKGKRSEIGEYYHSTNYPITGIGGIYIEKGDPAGTATSGLTCNNVRINNVLISNTKAHGIYINTPILSSITNTGLSGCGGHGIYILGGTSINMENVYASSGNFAGFCIQNASYVQLANCVAETFGIGFLIRGSNSVTLHCPGVEQTSNFGRYPWRNTLTSGKISTSTNSNLGIYGLGLVHTGSTERIKDVVSDLENCFIGYGIYITGGDGINVFSPYIKSIGQSKSGTIGYTNSTTPSDKLNFISVVGTANLVNIINPHFKMSDGDSTIIGTIKNEIKIGKDAKYVDISYSTDSSPLKENVAGVLKYTTSSSDKACIYTENGENIDTITLKIDNVYESLFAKTMYAENGFFETSDARKKDIQGELPLDKAYDFIRNCEPILYNLKGSDKTQIGLIAQEVREFFPEIVNEDDEGYLTLDYAKLTVVILRVLKDLIDQKK